MSEKRGPLLPAGNAHIIVSEGVSVWNILGSLLVQKVVFLAKKQGKKQQKTVVFGQNLTKKRGFWG